MSSKQIGSPSKKRIEKDDEKMRKKDHQFENTRRPSEKVITKIQAMKDKKGLIAAIEPDTGDYFLGRTLTESIKKAKSKYPGKVFYAIRIGSTFVHEHKGGLKRT